MKFRTIILCLTLFTLPLNANAELLGEEWINEAMMKKQSAFARQHNLVVTDLKCKFREGVENPGRKDVLFRADFIQTQMPVPWGWTFDANAPNLAAEENAKKAGFVVAGEDYYELTGVTWVRCKLWVPAEVLKDQ